MSTEVTEVADSSAPVELVDEQIEAQNTPDSTADSGDVETKQEEPTKTFTQAEVDALVQKRLLKEERRVHRRIEQQLREQQQAQALRNEPRRESFADDDEFLQAQVEHLAEVKAQEKLMERQRAIDAEKSDESYLDRVDKAIERYPDYHSVVGDSSLPISTAMAKFIKASENGPDIAYYLGKNPAKAAEIARLQDPVDAALALFPIQQELAARPKAQVSKAPEPITPVGQRGKSSASTLPSDDDDIDTWMQKENARMRSR